jgi:hypothetical protein
MATPNITAARWDSWSPRGIPGSTLVDYHNCLTTLGLPANPYSPVRYASLQMLINWRRLSEQERRQTNEFWYGLSGRQNPISFRNDNFVAGDPDSATCQQLMHLSFAAYGGNLDNRSIGQWPDIVRYPWALTDSEFLFCYRVLKYGGKVPEKEEMSEAMRSVIDVLRERALETAREVMVKRIEDFAIVVAGTAAGAATKVRRFTLVGLLSGFAIDIARAVLTDRMKRAQVERFRAAYEIDRVRRGPSCRA